MEQARLVIAIALSLFVFILWNFFFAEKKENQPPKPIQKEEQKAGDKPNILKKEQVVAKKSTLPAKIPTLPMKPARTVTVKTPLYIVKISEKGAVFKSYVLKNYRDTMRIHRY
jgi:YidC/Oxa1 family membrane protein insertase